LSTPRFKLITSNSVELFEERLHAFLDQLDRDDMIVDVKFATTAHAGGVEFSALVQYQKPEAWR